MASMVPMSLNEVTSSSTCAGSDQCTLSSSNDRTSDDSSSAADQCTFQFAMAMPSIMPVPALCTADTPDKSNHHDDGQ